MCLPSSTRTQGIQNVPSDLCAQIERILPGQEAAGNSKPTNAGATIDQNKQDKDVGKPEYRISPRPSCSRDLLDVRFSETFFYGPSGKLVLVPSFQKHNYGMKSEGPIPSSSGSDQWNLADAHTSPHGFTTPRPQPSCSTETPNTPMPSSAYMIEGVGALPSCAFLPML